jgi:hypothetical protein
MERERPREPYYGTGVVVRVDNKAWVAFGSSPRPKYLMHFLVVRTNALVGKVSVDQPFGEPADLAIIEGSPRVGDIVIGIQNERKYQRGK